MNLDKNNRGFTLIELLVVIAIIGILSSVVLAWIQTGRERARLADVQRSLRSIVPVALLCLGGGENLNCGEVGSPTPCSGGQPNIDALICVSQSVTEVWPSLPLGWDYNSDASSNFLDSTFTFSATGDGDTVICTQSGCETQPGN